MDYIIGTDCRLFQDVAVQDMRYHLDHYMVLSCLREYSAKYLTGYLQKERCSPLWTLCRDLASEPDKIFQISRTIPPTYPPPPPPK